MKHQSSLWGMDAALRFKGVTLIELMVTIAIVAIMAVMAAPSLQTFIRTTQIRTAVTEMTAALNYARSEAIKRGWPVTLCKTADANASSLACNNAADWQDGWIVFSDLDQDGTLDTGESAIRVGKTSTSNLDIDGSTNFSNYITYLPTGISAGNGGSADGTITMCLAGMQRMIDISTTGRISIESGVCA